MEVEKRIVVNGGMKLPIGYRFHPTDQELILHYLLPKTFASPLPSSIIPVFDVFFSHPLILPGEQKEKKRYFFCKKREQVLSNEHKIKISSGDGYWKPIGKEREVIACGKIIGTRRQLAFYETNKSSSSSSNCHKTRWSMTEYCLTGFASTKVFGDWAVYNVHENKRSKGRRQRKDNEENLSYIQITIESDDETGPPPPSPPASGDESGSII